MRFDTDHGIFQELPSIVQDSELTATRILPPPSKSQSIMLAGIYHAKLAQIISGILKDMYNIRPSRPEVRETLAAKHNNALRQWRQGIAHFLDVDASLLNPLFQRQSNVLRLAHAHALILVHRPFLLWSFEDLARGSHSRASARYSRAEESVGECLRAALTIVGIVNEICEGGQHYRAFWVCSTPCTLSSLIMFAVHELLRLLCCCSNLCFYNPKAIRPTFDMA